MILSSFFLVWANWSFEVKLTSLFFLPLFFDNNFSGLIGILLSIKFGTLISLFSSFFSINGFVKVASFVFLLSLNNNFPICSTGFWSRV